MSTAYDVSREAPQPRGAEVEHVSLRLWLQLFRCTATIERYVREKLRQRFDITLPRFDLMAQLNREPKGLKMTEVSRRLMVTGGNVTGLTDQLVAEGLVVRRGVRSDRRAFIIRLTPKGKRQFDVMALEPEKWIEELLSDLSLNERQGLHESIAHLRAAVVAKLAAQGATDE